MTIIKKKVAPEPTAKAAAQFEAPETEETETVETKVEAKPAVTERIAEAAATHAATHAVAVAKVAPVPAVQRGRVVSPFEAIKDVYKVDYNTLLALQASNGNFLDKAAGTTIGDSIVLKLMSYQANFVVSPNEDSEAAKALVKYSDDGKTLKDGTPVAEYLADLKAADYPDSKVTERVVLVGALVDPGKRADLQDTLVQINLPPSCKTLFDRYQIQSAFDISKGKTTLEQVSCVRITCRVKKAGQLIWTETDFAPAG